MLSRSEHRLAALEVLELIAAGRTNADAAGRLVVSPGTAEHHASALLITLRVPRAATPPCRARALERLPNRTTTAMRIPAFSQPGSARRG
jgi:DNA-binding NarL/FixJ family response regulator